MRLLVLMMIVLRFVFYQVMNRPLPVLNAAQVTVMLLILTIA